MGIFYRNILQEYFTQLGLFGRGQREILVSCPSEQGFGSMRKTKRRKSEVSKAVSLGSPGSMQLQEVGKWFCRG